MYALYVEGTAYFFSFNKSSKFVAAKVRAGLSANRSGSEGSEATSAMLEGIISWRSGTVKLEKKVKIFVGT